MLHLLNDCFNRTIKRNYWTTEVFTNQTYALTIELSLDNNATGPVLSATTFFTDALTEFTLANPSYEWSLLSVHIKCELMSLDNSLHKSYVKT